MKKPTSLYLNELQVNRVARRLEKALDGHGSLSGFFTWLEERAYAALMEGEYKDPQSERAWEDYLGAMGRWHRRREREAEAAYRQAWERLAERLPWHRENPAASHVLALFTLKMDVRALWDYPRGVKVGAADPFWSLFTFSPSTQDVLTAFRRAAQPPKKEVAPTALLWLSDRLEVLREAPRARPVSFYFEEAAHAVMLRAFEGTLFDRLLGTLDELLAGWGNYAESLIPEARFLEHPASFYRRWPLRVPDTVFVKSDELASTPEDVEWLAALLGVLEGEGQDELPLSDRLAISSPHGVTWEVLARLAERFGWERVRDAVSDAHYAHYFDFIMPFRLAFDLNLIDPLHPRAGGVEERTPGTFLARYGLNELRPERRLMYQVVKRRLRSFEDRVQDPLEFHVLRLLQAYALEVLPPEEREPERVSHPVLGILGRTDLFRTRDTLEAWSGMRVRVEGPDRWRLFKGRKLWRELTDDQAFGAAELLAYMAEPVHTAKDFEGYPRDTMGWLADARKDLPRVAYPLGVEPLECALRVLATPTSFEGEDRRAELERWRERNQLLVSALEKLATPPNPNP